MNLLEAQERRVKDLFSGEFHFFIPHYQRPYCWGEEQITELFEDLMNAISEMENEPNEERRKHFYYFLGSIVLVKKKLEESAEVIDGQQRLTSLVILLVVLRDLFKESSLKKTITRHLYQEGNAIENKEGLFRFIPHKSCRDYFNNHILNEKELNKLLKAKRLSSIEEDFEVFRDNARLLHEKLQEFSEEDYKKLYSFIMNNTSVIVITTPDLNSSYRIFNTINNRGMDLSPVDLIKTKLFSILERAGKTVLKSHLDDWVSYQEELGNTQFEEYLKIICSIFKKKRLQNEFYLDFFECVLPSYQSNVSQLFIEVLTPYLEYWRQIKNRAYQSSSDKDNDRINRYFYWLQLLTFKEWVAPLLYFLKNFEHEDDAVLLRFCARLERLSYFFLLSKSSVNIRTKRFSDIILELERNEFKGNIDNIQSLQLSKAEVRKFQKLIDGDVYKISQKATLSLLHHIEFLLDEENCSFDKKMTIEHVLPQTIASTTHWSKLFSSDEHAKWLHRLGNLVLLDRRKNAAAQNRDFVDKKKKYFEKSATPFSLTNQLLKIDEWNISVLQARQKELVVLLTKYWELEDKNTLF